MALSDLPDHSCFRENKIPRVGIRFAQLQLAHEFYVSYAKKVGFATKIRTTCDKITNFRGSRIKAPRRKNTILAAGCKARIYVKFDREKQEWVFFKVELKHLHPCSAKKKKKRELTMHAKCVIEDNDEAGIRPNKTFLILAMRLGGHQT
ncbi:hypothetical protein Ahy_B05g075530 [Arachis hypogaea]|uniref:FAR1 domain-containing protein n=1 Tax=Arachis hypogaea TaxID=3818 RepID=A0A444Z1D9_ARAHY|nr:hypothetical protein Ahy_B05g075530 [Arachis hypogaea]